MGSSNYLKGDFPDLLPPSAFCYLQRLFLELPLRIYGYDSRGAHLAWVRGNFEKQRPQVVSDCYVKEK